MSATRSPLSTKTDDPRAVDTKHPASDYRSGRRSEDAAGLVAVTPWINLYLADAMYPLIGAYSP